MSSSKKVRSNSPIVIIGSGLAGYTLVRELRKLDPNIAITVLTADDGSYYSKPQLSNAFTHHKTPDQLILFSAEKFSQQFKIDIYPHTMVSDIDIDKSCCMTSSGEFNFSQLVLACGAVPKSLPNMTNFYQVNNLQDYRQFREKIADERYITIIGAGLVGCEFANDLVNADYQVTVIAPENSPLERLIGHVPEAGEYLKIALQEKGVHWQLGKPILSNQQFNTKIILSAIGLRPNLTLANKAKLNINRGIVVNQFLQTSQPNIYALGDCAEVMGEVLPYIGPISLGARALAKTLLSEKTAVHYPPIPIYIKTPIYPIVTLPPPVNSSGHWQVEIQDKAIKALYIDHQQQLRGFTLTDKATAETVNLVKQIAD